MQVVVLHDDYLTAARGAMVARGIAAEMELEEADTETKFWNIALLDTVLGRGAVLDALHADVVVVALRDSAGFSRDLKMWLRRWLVQTKNTSAALIAVFENHDEPVAREARAFFKRAARSAGREFFSEPGDSVSIDGGAEVHEFLWVL